MPEFTVEMTGEAREVFHVTADSAEAARELVQNATGELTPSVMENSGMEVTSVREDPS